MQTWHIRLVTREGRPVTRLRAPLRYLRPGCGSCRRWRRPLAGLQARCRLSRAVVAGVLAYAALAWLHPDASTGTTQSAAPG